MKGRIFLALALIAIGVVLLLNNLGMGVLPNKLELWPVILMAFGAAIGADAVRRNEKDPLFGAVILFFVGLLFLLTESGYLAGGLGKLVYSEGEYYHYMPEPIDSYQGWRVGLPPQWYPTHSDAYCLGVNGGSFTEVSCQGMPSIVPHLRPENNAYRNPFGTEIALFRTSEGGMSRMAVSWDTPGASGEMGRVRGQRGSYYGQFEGIHKELPATRRPPLPPGVGAGGHGGSHGYLANEFVLSILQNRRPLVDIALALNMTVAGIVAHQSALRDGERLKIPQYAL